ncbi:MAG: hypothetical protein A2Y78_11330 [Acidobacteria bacterium RBG_13_68_16]|nr:MAG: hypothetical protein A2Y78_11330 [Acidobacteria bacterium RBG_13_68_16]
MVMYFCPFCNRETEHLNVTEAAQSAHVTRRTVYNWLDRSLVHCVHRPSGRKFICMCSLVMSDSFKSSPPPDQVPIHKLFVRRPSRAHGKHP